MCLECIRSALESRHEYGPPLSVRKSIIHNTRAMFTTFTLYGIAVQNQRDLHDDKTILHQRSRKHRTKGAFTGFDNYFHQV